VALPPGLPGKELDAGAYLGLVGWPPLQEEVIPGRQGVLRLTGGWAFRGKCLAIETGRGEGGRSQGAIVGVKDHEVGLIEDEELLLPLGSRGGARDEGGWGLGAKACEGRVLEAVVAEGGVKA
jgi:hypothetical protein